MAASLLRRLRNDTSRTRRAARRRPRLESLEPRRLLFAEPIISEFMAANNSTIDDGDGASSDWIELYNAGDEAIDLDGWHLTDRADNLDKWTFPSVELAAGEFLLVFASGQNSNNYVDAEGYLHTNFKLSAGGEYLALVQPDGITPVSEFTPQFDRQFSDISYGVAMDSSNQLLVEPGDPTEVLIPTGDVGQTWTEHDFVVDGSWITESSPGVGATTGVGFDSGGANPNLVANWPLDEPPGTSGGGSIKDIVVGHDGTPTAGTTAAPTFEQPGAAAYTGTSASFDTTRIDVPQTSALNPTSFTFAAWVKPGATAAHQSVVTSRYDAGNTYGYILYHEPNGNWAFWTGRGSTGWDNLGGPPVQVDQWQHVAITYDATTQTKTIYLNGSPTSAGGRQYAQNTARDLHLGAGGDAGTQYYYNGSIDDAAVWGTALDATAIANAMNGGADTVTGNQVAHWRLDESAGTSGPGSVVDSAGGDQNGTVASAFALGQPGASGATGTSAYFGDNSVDVPYHTDLNPESFTVTLWANPASTGSHASPITNRYDQWGAAGKTYGFVLYNVNGDWGFWTGNEIGTEPWHGTVATGAVDVGQWQHLAVSYDAATNTKKLYIDGTEAASDTGVGGPLYVPNTVRDLHIGGGGDAGDEFRFRGQIDDVALFNAALDQTTIQDIMAAGTPAAGVAYADLIGTDVAAPMQTVNASAYVRVPFTLADASGISNLQLRMKYDDGFAAYLNGELVVTRNAPATLQWNSASNAPRPANLGRQYEQISLTDHIAHLRTGQNVLAIHGLNESAADEEFLILPELESFAVTLPGGAAGYFTIPTPGAPNGDVFAEIGPIINAVSHTPNEPTDVEPVVVTAVVAESSNPVDGATLHYRVMYDAEVALPLSDDGSGADAVAGDGVFTGVIPAGVAAPGEMLRYYVTAVDTSANEMREPRITDTEGQDQSPEYLGTVVADPSVTTDLPVFHWFTQDYTNAHNRTGARASIFCNGEFYDNIFARERGQATNASSQKFDFDDDHLFYVNDVVGRVEEINMNAQGSDPTYLRQTLAFEAWRDAGVPSSESFLMRMEVNGNFDRVGIYIEQVDDLFLERHGLDGEGALYKFVQRQNLDPVFNDVTTGVEKKTRFDEDFSDIQAVVDGLHLPTLEQRTAWVFDNFNVPEIVNYLAIRAIIQDADDIRKNFYFYRDTNGNGEWSIYPWDNDFTFGIRGDGGPNLDHPFFGEFEHLKLNANQWNVMLDVLFEMPETQEMYLRRLRTLMDSESKQTAPSVYEDRIVEMYAQAAADLALHGVSQSTINAIAPFFPEQREDFYVTHSIDNMPGGGIVSTLIGEFVAGARYFVPTDDTLGLTWTTDTFDDTGWLTGQTGIGYEDTPADYASLINTPVNPTDTPGGATSTFVRIPFTIADQAALDSIVANGLTLRMKYDDGFVAYINGSEAIRRGVSGTPGELVAYDAAATNHADSSAVVFENLNITTSVGQLQVGANVLAIQGVNTGTGSSDMLILPELIEGTLGGGDDVAGIPHAQDGNPLILIDEFDQNPLSGNQDEEYLRLANPNATSVDVTGWTLSGGVDFTFQPGTVITAGGTLYVSPDVNAFRARAVGPTGGQGLFVQGSYGGHLSNLGEDIFLHAADGTLISSITTDFIPTPAQEHLRISEVMYNPPAPSQAEFDAGFVDNDDFEFIELVNTSDSVTLTLDGIAFTQGILFTFADTEPDTTLAPGERILVVRDQAAFEARYDTAGMTIAGQYTDGLGGNKLNNDGEILKLDDADGSTIHEFRYNDNPAEDWPGEADGLGSSLEVVNTASDYDEATTWYGSVEIGGTPGEAATPAVLRRMVFYGGSAFEVGGPDNAVATDKQALLPGETATAANYTNFADGINGLIVDVANPSDHDQLGLDDLMLSVGNDNTPGAWDAAAAPTLVVLSDGGVGGATRLLMTWSVGDVSNTWLRVALAADPAASGLPAEDVFYFGNAIGDTGNDSGNALVTAADLIAIRDNPRGDANRAGIANPLDVNRDMRVDAADQLLARNHATGPFNALRLIAPPLPVPPPPGAEGEAVRLPVTDAKPNADTSTAATTSEQAAPAAPPQVRMARDWPFAAKLRPTSRVSARAASPPSTDRLSPADPAWLDPLASDWLDAH